MDLAPDLALAKLRCAPFHASTGADPIGSAGAYDAFLVVEVPLPWEQDVTLQAPFSALTGKAAAITGADGRRWRPMAVVPDAGDDGVRVTAYDHPSGVLRRFDRREWSVDRDRVVDLCRSLLDAGPGAGAEDFDGDRVDPDPDLVDLLVCTHGRRDACCGSQGATVHQELARALADEPSVRVRRCSHTGGHRFAATGISFPDGYAWAHLGPEIGVRLATRSVPPDQLALHCRGTSLFDGGPAQAADRVALGQTGWDWSDAVRRAEVVAHERDTLATTVRIAGDLPDGRRRAWEVRVEVQRWVPTPTCGSVDRPEYDVAPVWAVTSVEPLPVD
jgi:hypothetical protein